MALVSAILSPPLPLDRKLTLSPLEPAMSTMPSPIRATPPVTTAPLVIRTTLLEALANRMPELWTVPVTDTTPPLRVSTMAPTPIGSAAQRQRRVARHLEQTRCCDRTAAEHVGAAVLRLDHRVGA